MLFECVCMRCIFYLLAGDVLEVLACHDASEFGFNKALCPLSLWRPAKERELFTLSQKQVIKFNRCLRILIQVYWLVDKHGRWVWPCCLQVLHGVPLVDAALVWSDAALVVSHPGERHASREVVIPAWHLAYLVQHLQGWPRLGLFGEIKVIVVED